MMVSVVGAKKFRERILSLPDHLRESLKGPKGELFSKPGLGAAQDACSYIQKKKLTPIIAVGDLVSINLSKVSCPVTLFILDGKTKRNDPLDHNIVTDVEFETTNAAAEIRPEVWVAIELALLMGKYGKTAKLLIEGEEDLTALPAVALAPVGSAVVYGLPDQGIVVIDVTARDKKQVDKIFQQMV